MLQAKDIYDECRKKFPPLTSIFLTIGDAVKQDKNLNYYEMVDSLNRSAKIIYNSIYDLNDENCSPEKSIFINKQIELASLHLSRYISSEVVNRFIVELTVIFLEEKEKFLSRKQR